MDMVIDQSGQSISRSSNRVEITREVQVNIFHGHDLRKTAAGGATLKTHHRALGRLTNCDNRFLTQAVERIS